MSVMFNASVPCLIQSLHNLLGILQKAMEFAESKKIASETMASSRLAIDMLPLTKQVQIACDTAKGCAGRLSGVTMPKYEDNEQTLEELKNRTEKTLAFLNSLSPEQFEGSESREIELKFPNMHMNFKGEDYLYQFVLPNFYFHLTYSL